MERVVGFIFRHYAGALTLASLAAVVNKVFDLAPPILVGWFVDSLQGAPPAFLATSNVVRATDALAVATVVVFAVESAFEWAYLYYFMVLAQNVQHDLRQRATAAMLHREQAFFSNARAGDVIANLVDDVNQLERFVATSAAVVIHLVTLLIFAGIWLAGSDVVLTLIGMAAMPFVFLGSRWFGRRVSPRYKAVRDTNGQVGEFLQECRCVCLLRVSSSWTLRHARACEFE